MAANVTIRTSDGRVYTDPSQIHIPRNEKNEMFYRIVDQFKAPEKPSKEKTA
jgi:hypothetical protein